MGDFGFEKCEQEMKGCDSPKGLSFWRRVVKFTKGCVLSKGLCPFQRLWLFKSIVTFLQGCFFPKSCDLSHCWLYIERLSLIFQHRILPSFAYFYKKKIDLSCLFIWFVAVILSSLKLLKFEVPLLLSWLIHFILGGINL